MGKLNYAGRCELCGTGDVLYRISKQIGGAFYLKDVCKSCYYEHQKELEMTRKNFQVQFGDR